MDTDVRAGVEAGLRTRLVTIGLLPPRGRQRIPVPRLRHPRGIGDLIELGGRRATHTDPEGTPRPAIPTRRAWLPSSGGCPSSTREGASWPRAAVDFPDMRRSTLHLLRRLPPSGHVMLDLLGSRFLGGRVRGRRRDDRRGSVATAMHAAASRLDWTLSSCVGREGPRHEARIRRTSAPRPFCRRP